MEKKTARTPIKNVEFEYTGSLEEGMHVFRASADHTKSFFLSLELIEYIKSVMEEVCPAYMGGRINPSVYSIGYTLLKKKGTNPQCLSYVVPLLIEAGFCEVDKKTHEIKIVE